MKRLLNNLMIVSLITVFILGIYQICFRSFAFESNIWASADAFDMNDIQKLNMREGNEFKIIQITDLHFAGIFTYNNARTYEFLSGVLDEENPDLAVVTGDVTIALLNALMIKEFCEFMESKQIYWCYTLGNHDYQFGSNVKTLVDLVGNYDHCLFRMGATNIGGYGNEFLTIVDNSEQIKYSICLLDTSEYGVGAGQVDWYQWNLQEINLTAGTEIKNLTFMHIPMQILKEREDEIFGVRENINCLKYENGLFEKMVELGMTTHIFSGHDHMNNFIYETDGMMFCSLSTSGYSGYNSTALSKSVRIIELVNDNVSLRTVYDK